MEIIILRIGNKSANSTNAPEIILTKEEYASTIYFNFYSISHK